jgi:hypothetical protein
MLERSTCRGVDSYVRFPNNFTTGRTENTESSS